MLDAHPPLIMQPTRQHILLGCSQDVHSSICRDHAPLASCLSWIAVKYFICVFLQPLRCLFASLLQRSAPTLIVAVHLNTIRRGSAFCHRAVIFEKACIGVFVAQTQLSALLRGKSPQMLLFQVLSFKPDDSLHTLELACFSHVVLIIRFHLYITFLARVSVILVCR